MGYLVIGGGRVSSSIVVIAPRHTCVVYSQTHNRIGKWDVKYRNKIGDEWGKHTGALHDTQEFDDNFGR